MLLESYMKLNKSIATGVLGIAKAAITGKAPADSVDPEVDAMLHQLALDLFKDKVFTSNHCYTPQEILQCFPIISFVDDEDDLKAIGETVDNGGLIYEYMSEAAPLGLNGMPMFFSLRELSPEKTAIMENHYAKILEGSK